VTDDAAQVEEVAREVRLAYELGDIQRIGALLAPNVTWGPPRGPSTCQSKSQVLAWYENGRNAGAHAQVEEIEIVGQQLLVGLVIVGAPLAHARSSRSPRWQVLSVRGAHIVDIVGFEQKSDAVSWMSR
jgi:hypothetical protein